MITLKPHQEKAVADFWARDGKAYLYGDVGIGKTYIAAEIIKQLVDRIHVERPADIPKILILVPANQADQWTEKRAEYYAGASLNYSHHSFIFNIEKIGLMAHMKAVQATQWDLIIVDEAHALNNPTGTRTKIFKKLRTTYKLAMSATPNPNTEWEWWSMIDWISPGLLGKSFWHFKQDACILNYFKGIERLRDPEGFRATIAPHIIRVEQDVLDLAPVVSNVRPCFPDNDYMDEYHKMRKECVATLKGEKVMIANTLAMIGRLRQFTDCPSVYSDEDHTRYSPKRVHLMTILRNDPTPTLIFVEFTDAITEIEECLEGRYKYGIISGGVPQRHRTAIQKEFQAGELDVLIGTSAMAQGLNLQRAERIIHYSYPWNNARVQQRTGRAHRMGVEHEVEEIFLLVPGTIDEKIAALVEKKKRMAGKYTRAELLSLLDA